MSDQQKEKIKYFINDPQMSSAVYHVLLSQFIKPKSGALTEEKAAKFISIENLQEAWKVIESYKTLSENQQTVTRQVGL